MPSNFLYLTEKIRKEYEQPLLSVLTKGYIQTEKLAENLLTNDLRESETKKYKYP